MYKWRYLAVSSCHQVQTYNVPANVHDGPVVRINIEGAWNALSMIWRTWVWTSVGSNWSVCSKSVLNHKYLDILERSVKPLFDDLFKRYDSAIKIIISIKLLVETFIKGHSQIVACHVVSTLFINSFSMVCNVGFSCFTGLVNLYQAVKFYLKWHAYSRLHNIVILVRTAFNIPYHSSGSQHNIG